MATSDLHVRKNSPRQVADKSHKENLLRAIRMSLEIESPAVRHNTQVFNRNRYRAVSALPDYEALKDELRAIKERAISDLPNLLKVLERSVRARGGSFFLAATREEACRYILAVCLRANARLVVKGKSMTSEEVGLNHVLEGAGIEVAESDLAEFILQVADEQPSHIIAPAIHYSRERITELFKRKFDTGETLDTGEDLTRFARERLREKFLHADVGITGANLIAADTGSLLLVESEGNIRMSTLLPSVHIAIAGIEKVISSVADFGPFVELLAASGTGQKMTSYTSVLAPPLSAPPFALPGRPRRDREFHLVLVDNGRSTMREDPVLNQALYCIRCSACLNSCANFQAVGGHAFGGETYSGGIGAAWEAGTTKLENARFAEMCTGCSRCVAQCPARIDIPWLNESLRDRLNHQNTPRFLGKILGMMSGADPEDFRAGPQKIFFANYHWFASWGSRIPHFANWIGRRKGIRSGLASLFGVESRRGMPPFSSSTLVKRAKSLPSVVPAVARDRVVLFADVYTNYGFPERGLALLRVLRGLRLDVVVSKCLPAGRAPLSQGMISTARKHAAVAARMLAECLEEGREIVVVEPSVLALFRRDYEHLLFDHDLSKRIREHSFDPLEFVLKALSQAHLRPSEVFDVEKSPVGRRLFFHAHCQQKTIGCAGPAERLLRDIGFDVVSSEVECCGMAGSFGYKNEFYDLSMRVSEDLLGQIGVAELASPRALVVTGVSCTEQLRSGLGRAPLHPIELLAACMRTLPV